MKAGDRVQLTEKFGEFEKGKKGTVVNYTKPAWLQSNLRIAVLFDGEKYLCAGHTINDDFIPVISKCVLI